MMMKFFALALFVAASVGLVTAQAQNDGAGVVCPAVCKSVACGPEGLLVEVCATKVVNGKCTWPCPPLTCAQQGRGCATVKCSTGPCVEDPVTCVPTCTSPPTLPTPSGPDMCIQGGAPPAECSGEGQHEWDNKACKFICKTCAQQGRGCATVKCATGPCVEDPVTCEATCAKPICTEKCTAKCKSNEKCVLDEYCQPQCQRSIANTCLLNDGNSRIVSGGKYYYECNQCTCGNNGQPGICTRKGCGDGPFNNNGSTQTCAEQGKGCSVLDCLPGKKCVEDSSTCVATCEPDTVLCTQHCKEMDCPGYTEPQMVCNKAVNNTCAFVCPAPPQEECINCALTNCGINMKCIDNNNNGCGKCVFINPPQPICTEKCTAKCSFGQKCVFDKTCTPTCRTSTDNTCLLNDGVSRIVSGGKYYQQCNTCTCGGACTEIGCQDGEYNNDGTLVPPPVCTEKCTAKCSTGEKCVFDKTCTPTCKSSITNTCVLNDGNSRIVSGGRYYQQCNICTCQGICTKKGCENTDVWNNDGTPSGCRSNEGNFVPIGGSYFNECNSCTCKANGASICTLVACPAGVCWDDKGKEKPCPCHNFRGIKCPDDSWECVNNPCTMDVCILEPPGTCRKKTTPTPKCELVCPANCGFNPDYECVTDPTTKCGKCVIKPTQKPTRKPCVCTGVHPMNVEICADGTTANWKCVADAKNKCSWQAPQCPTPVQCLINPCDTPKANSTCIPNSCVANYATGCNFDCKKCTAVARSITFTIITRASLDTAQKILKQMRDVADDAGVGSSMYIPPPITNYIKYVSGTRYTKTWTVTVYFKNDSCATQEDNMNAFKTQLQETFTTSEAAASVASIDEQGAEEQVIVDDNSYIILPASDAAMAGKQACADGTEIDAAATCPRSGAFELATPASSSSSSTPIALIVAPIVGGVVLLAIIMAAVVVMRRRQVAQVKTITNVQQDTQMVQRV